MNGKRMNKKMILGHQNHKVLGRGVRKSRFFKNVFELISLLLFIFRNSLLYLMAVSLHVHVTLYTPKFLHVSLLMFYIH